MGSDCISSWSLLIFLLLRQPKGYLSIWETLTALASSVDIVTIPTPGVERVTSNGTSVSNTASTHQIMQQKTVTWTQGWCWILQLGTSAHSGHTRRNSRRPWRRARFLIKKSSQAAIPIAATEPNAQSRLKSVVAQPRKNNGTENSQVNRETEFLIYSLKAPDWRRKIFQIFQVQIRISGNVF